MAFWPCTPCETKVDELQLLFQSMTSGIRMRLKKTKLILTKDDDVGNNILRDFKNALFYILFLFHMIDLRIFFLYHFLSSCKMDHDLP